jgi:hypothetical protein
MAKIGKLFGAGSLIKSQNYLRRVVYRTTVEDPWSMRVHELRAAVIAEAAPGAAFLFPDRDQTIFKPDWHLASIWTMCGWVGACLTCKAYIAATQL